MSELNLLKKPEILFEKKIIIYGTGSSAEDFRVLMEQLSVYPVAYCDSNVKKKGMYFMGSPIVSPDDLLKFINIQEFCIIICSKYIKDIYNTLQQKKVPLDIVYTKFTALLAVNYYAMRYSFPHLQYIKDRNLLINEIIKAGNISPYNGDSLLDMPRIIQMLLSNKPIVLNFAPGKTGSSSVFNAIDKNKYITYHLHDFEKLLSELKLKSKVNIWEKCLKILKHRKIKIIAGVREPISREISAFFQFLSISNGMLIDYNMEFVEAVSSFLLETIGESLYNNEIYKNQGYNKYLLSHNKYGCEFDWFDMELKKYWGIDVYKKEFNQKQGYQIYKNENVEVFVYQLEKLNALEEKFGKFLGESDFKLKHMNISGEKNYFLLYCDVLNTINIPKKFFDFYYINNMYFQHFYSLEDIKKFQKKWCDRLF